MSKMPVRAWLSRNVVVLSLASLFGDVSTEMLYPILPVFLTQVLGASGSVIGMIDGLAQATQNLVQGLSGALSDRLGRRKAIALTGFLLAAFSKPLIGLAPAWPGVLGARLLDRVGAGTRSAPRDALIAESVSDADRGKAFGLEGLGDNLGACLGPLLAVLLLSLLVDMRVIFYLALVPGLLACLMVLLVKERPTDSRAQAKLDLRLHRFPRSYWLYLAATGIFCLGSSSNAFLILQTQAVGISVEGTVLIYSGFNLVAAAISYPTGMLADRFGRRALLLCAFGVFLVTYLGFAISHDVVAIAMLFVGYGAYQGIFRAAGKALAADLVPAEIRASGIGWYTAVVGLSQLVAGIVAGQLWDRVGHEAVFIYGAIFAVAGGLALLLLVPGAPGRPRGE